MTNKDDIFEALLVKCDTQTGVGDRLGETRQTVNKWFSKGVIPPEHWNGVVDILGGEYTIEDLYRVFVANAA